MSSTNTESGNPSCHEGTETGQHHHHHVHGGSAVSQELMIEALVVPAVWEKSNPP